MENNQKPFNLPFSQNLPIILIGNLSVEPLRAAGIIEEALTQVKDKLTEFIASPTLATDLQTVFGQSTNVQEARTLLDGLPVSDELPQITLVSADLMNGAVGGFDSLTGTVYLADSLIDPNTVITSDTQPSPHLVNVIIEELGHWLDSQLNQVDTPGDEGELLAALVQGDGLSQEDIGRLKNEDDRGLICVEGKPVAVEMSGLSITGSDGVAPELVGVSLTARSVDASSSQGSMGVKLQVSDNSSGFNYGSVSFSSPSGQNSFGLYLRDDPSYLVSGTELAGTYSIKELLPEGAEAGTWTFSSLSLSDDAGNYGYYDGNALQLLGINPNSLSFTVTNVNSDAVAPELIGVNLTATSVDVSSGQGSMGVKLQVSDNSSGFNYGSVSFSSPSGQNSFGLYLRDDPSYLVSGTELAGTYSIKELLPEGAEAGTWTFSSLSLSDDAGNYGYYDGNALQLLGINPNSLSFTVKYTTPTSAQISIKDTQIIEGDNGKKQAKFTVSLNTKVNQKVEVNYATSDGTAKAGEDYKRTNGKLTFQPGETSKTVNVPVFGDTKLEGNETFKLLLSKPKNAQLGKKQAIGSITNDDLAKISIKDTQIIEGDDGKKQAKFTVSLNTKVNQKVEVSYATSDGTAKVGEDYQRTKGKLTFKPNQTQKTILVPILGDTLDEDNETFFLNLSQPKNADLGDKRAIGKITDNDTGSDKPGDSFKTAVNLGKVKQEIIRDDQIGFLEGGSYRDTDDYYRFQLDRKGTLLLTLQKLSKDADIKLYGSEQELITEGINDGTNPEIIEYQLDPGIYYVKVYPKVKTYTNYRLTVDFS